MTLAHDEQREHHQISLCSLQVGSRLFGIDTCEIREVLGTRIIDRVPLAPSYIGGVVPYRGEVLITVSARAVLGLPAQAGPTCLLVLEADRAHTDSEHFGLIVDCVGGVVLVDRRKRAQNPSTLDALGRALFRGAFRIDESLLVELDPGSLHPSRLAASELFACERVGLKHNIGTGATGTSEAST